MINGVRHVGVVSGSFLVHLIIIGLSLSFGILISELHTEFCVSQARAAWVASLFTGLIGIAGVPVSWCVTRYGERKVGILGSIVLTTGMLTSTFVEGFNWFYLTYGIIGGIGASLSLLPSNTIVMKGFQTNRQLVIAIVSSGSAVGNLVLPPLLSHMISTYGWRGTFLLLGGIGLQCLPAALLYMSNNGKGPVKQDGDICVEKTDRKSFITSTRAVLHNPQFVLYGISAILCFFVVFAPGIFLPDLMKEVSMSDREIYIALMVMGTGHLVGTIAPGVLDSLFGLDLLSINCLVKLIWAAATLLVFVVDSLLLFLVMAVLLGMLSGAFLSLNVALIAHYLEKEHNDVGFGWICTLEGVAVVLGMPIAGWLIDVTNTVKTGFVFIGAMLVLSLTVSTALKVYIRVGNKRSPGEIRSLEVKPPPLHSINVAENAKVTTLQQNGDKGQNVIYVLDKSSSIYDCQGPMGLEKSDSYKQSANKPYEIDNGQSEATVQQNGKCGTDNVNYGYEEG